MKGQKRNRHRDRLFAADPHCRYCGRRLNRPTADHVVPKSRGGKSNRKNITVVCPRCNTLKDNRTPWEVLCWAVRICFVAVLLKVK